jgi:tetratricopeptide (TPR) repeat protein
MLIQNMGNFQNAISNHNQGNLTAAIEDYTIALSQSPNWGEAYIGRSMAYLALNLNQEALADLDRAIQYRPNHAAAFGFRGCAKAKLGDLSGAIDDFLSSADVYLQQGYPDKFRQMRTSAHQLLSISCRSTTPVNISRQVLGPSEISK